MTDETKKNVTMPSQTNWDKAKGQVFCLMGEIAYGTASFVWGIHLVEKAIEKFGTPVGDPAMFVSPSAKYTAGALVMFGSAVWGVHLAVRGVRNLQAILNNKPAPHG